MQKINCSKNQNNWIIRDNDVNPLSASVALIYKPVNWFAQQINWLVSIWGKHWHLMGETDNTLKMDSQYSYFYQVASKNKPC